MSDELSSRKIQPRNLTAHADAWVRGNSSATRPESGVDNCFPGLEFDQRNLDKRFLPGLEFEFHAGGVPPILRRVETQHLVAPLDITADDIAKGLFLVAVFGTFGAPDGGPLTRLQALDSPGGLGAWRVIHDLEPGPVGAVIGRSALPNLTFQDQVEINQLLADGDSLVRRQPDGIRFAVISGQRADYLRDGVINPDLFEAGDLTRSLCAPWQYDFADCGCFYWASNKPDMVAAEPEGDQFYNFQRIRDPATEPPRHGPGMTAAERRGFLTIGGWQQGMLGHRQMIERWETLPVVLDATEAVEFTPRAPEILPDAQVLSRAQVVERLRYLATVEHGLMVEYLYAHYSVEAPRFEPGADENAQRRFGIAKTVLGVAIDEMRHFRWVNEILRELGQTAVIGRVDEFQDLDNDARFLSHTFSLAPLTDARLQWFIDVERPSQLVDPSRAGDTIDGLYTRLLLSIRQNPAFTSDERARLLHLVKLIIDEGYDHHSRFLNVQAALAGTSADGRLRLGADPAPLAAGHPGKAAEIAADRAYRLVLTTLQLVFAQSNARTGDLLLAARHAMYALDDTAHELIRLGGAPLFSLPTFAAGAVAEALVAEVADPGRFVDDNLGPAAAGVVEELAAGGSAETAEAVLRHYDALQRMLRAALGT